MKVEFNVSGNDPKGRSFEEFLREYRDKLQGRAAEGEKITLNDAAEAVFYQGVSRVRATTNYAPKAKKAAPAKAPKAKKEAKPKGPLARKVKAAKAAAPKVRKAKPAPAADTAPKAEAPAAPVLD